MPKFHVSKSILINAKKEDIFPHVNDFNKWVAWSPWLLMEPEATVKVETDTKSYTWEGKRVGTGSMKVLEEKDNDFIDFDLQFLKPFKSKARTYMTLEEANDGQTKLTWEMDSSLPFFLFWMVKQMTVFVGMDYERGLLMLKEVVENGKIDASLSFIGEQQQEEFKYVGIKKSCSFSEIKETMGPLFAEIQSYAAKNPDNIAGKPLSVYHHSDPVKDLMTFTAAIQVKDTQNKPAHFEKGTVDASKIYRLRLTGDYKFLGNAWATMINLQQSKVFKINKSVPQYEIYQNDPTTVASKSEIITEVVFPIK